jgi:hypothetical protein
MSVFNINIKAKLHMDFVTGDIDLILDPDDFKEIVKRIDKNKIEVVLRTW